MITGKLFSTSMVAAWLLLSLLITPVQAMAQTSANEMGIAAIEQIDLNSADAETLARSLSGVGLSKAQAIVRYREQYGPFASLEELTEVTGIGPAILERNRDRLVLR
jgi:competence protein ComEA helix-hairpin-helix repeat region